MGLRNHATIERLSRETDARAEVERLTRAENAAIEWMAYVLGIVRKGTGTEITDAPTHQQVLGYVMFLETEVERLKAHNALLLAVAEVADKLWSVLSYDDARKLDAVTLIDDMEEALDAAKAGGCFE